jgi:transcriptional regulator with XRE-family HTH domain
MRDVTSHWCFLRDNASLKIAIQYKLKEKGLILAEIERQSGVPGYRISSWLNGKRPYPNQHQMLKLCTWLGIEVDLNVEFKDK